MYKTNNGYLFYCKTCCTQYYQNWQQKYESVDRAIRRCCEWLNIYYDPNMRVAAGDGIVGYIDDMFNHGRGFFSKSWDDTLAEEARIVDSEINTPFDSLSTRSPEVQEGVEIFGEGFPEDAYPMMLRTYHEYLDPLGNTVTATQKKSARFLSSLEYRCMEAIKQDKSNASALSSSLTKAIKESGFDTVQDQSTSNEGDTFGQWIERIEAYTPAQYVKQTPYKDVDNLGNYYDRFVRRPVENLLNRASMAQGDELSITDDEVDGGDLDDEA